MVYGVFDWGAPEDLSAVILADDTGVSPVEYGVHSSVVAPEDGTGVICVNLRNLWSGPHALIPAISRPIPSSNPIGAYPKSRAAAS